MRGHLQVGAAQRGEDRRAEHLHRDGPTDGHWQAGVFTLCLDGVAEAEVLLRRQRHGSAAEQARWQLCPAQDSARRDAKVSQERPDARVQDEPIAGHSHDGSGPPWSRN
jgi:hypothetical protein